MVLVGRLVGIRPEPFRSHLTIIRATGHREKDRASERDRVLGNRTIRAAVQQGWVAVESKTLRRPKLVLAWWEIRSDELALSLVPPTPQPRSPDYYACFTLKKPQEATKV